jgi:hypothetical protein
VRRKHYDHPCTLRARAEFGDNEIRGRGKDLNLDPCGAPATRPLFFAMGRGAT